MRGRYGEYINSDTGEIREGYLVGKGDKSRRGYKKRNDVSASLREMTSEMGEFYFSNYNELISTVENDTALAFRFLYLCTFMEYDGYIRDWRGNKVRMSELNRIFGLNLKPFYELKGKLVSGDLICSDERGDIVVNERFSVKGCINGTVYERNSIKVYDRGVQELYLKSMPREHGKIGKIVKLIPYINRESNIICSAESIGEGDVKKIRKLCTADVCRILGTDKSNINRIRKYLLGVKVGNRGLLGCFQYMSNDYYIVNPYVFYHGTDIERLRGLIRLFDAGSEGEQVAVR